MEYLSTVKHLFILNNYLNNFSTFSFILRLNWIIHHLILLECATSGGLKEFPYPKIFILQRPKESVEGVASPPPMSIFLYLTGVHPNRLLVIFLVWLINWSGKFLFWISILFFNPFPYCLLPYLVAFLVLLFILILWVNG